MTEALKRFQQVYGEIKLPFIDDQRRRLCFRNDHCLYRRKSDASSKEIISVYSSDKPYKVYESEYWYGDGWDGEDFGREINFSRPFFEQLIELQLKVPRLALLNVNAQNSDYCNMTVGSKDCYLVFGGDFNEKCMYGTLSMRNNSCFDCDYVNDSQFCYMCSDSFACYSCIYTLDSSNCSDCAFVSDCIGCSECILSTNLVQQSYCIFNKQYSKEEYLQRKKELLNGSYLQMQINLKNFLELRGERIVKYAHLINCENSNGDYLKNCKNCKNVFDVSNSEDFFNVCFGSKSKDCYYSGPVGDGSELFYNTVAAMRATNVVGSYFVIDSSNIEYCENTYNSHDCFGCSGIRNKRYCILNKQYPKEEYEKLREQLIQHMRKTGEWGDFLPKQMASFGYNESTAQDYFPLSRGDALAQGFKWHDNEEKNYEGDGPEIADNIHEINADILKRTLKCELSYKPFKLMLLELDFYKKMKLPIPRLCSEERSKYRKSLRNPRKLFQRKCQKCAQDLISTYSPDSSEKVYCEKCYLEVVY